jgi:hypothetical protein
LFLAFDAKGGERVDLEGVLIEGFVFFVCYLHASYLLYRPAFCDLCDCEIRESLWSILSLLYIMSPFLVLAHKVVLPCLTPISYELCLCVLTLHVLSCEYTLLAWNT